MRGDVPAQRAGKKKGGVCMQIPPSLVFYFTQTCIGRMMSAHSGEANLLSLLMQVLISYGNTLKAHSEIIFNLGIPQPSQVDT